MLIETVLVVVVVAALILVIKLDKGPVLPAVLAAVDILILTKTC